MKYWLVKQEPEEYSFDDLLRERKTDWTGIRNFQARNNLQATHAGDKVLFYHSTPEKRVVGVAQVSREAFSDPTDDTGKWFAIELTPLEKFKKSVTLDEIKAHADLQQIALVRQTRLSVLPLSETEFQTIVKLSKK
jgi:predicted RNA-binding protein with PUA-like domain